MRSWKSVIVMLFMVIAFQATAYAQKNTLGTSWSFSGIGLTYERNVSEEAFAQISVQTEMAETFLGKVLHPGISAAFTWNLIFAQLESRNGIPLRFYAGPGIAAGINHDMKTSPGLFFGLKGRVGMQCIYDRKINISVSLAPVLGLHVSEDEENVTTRAYRNGLMQILMPEFGISYRF